ncbi:hypothetical protein CLTEP_27830 [Clostridium tepidiprofundi DSM 19306]|uniref:Uncharacterized protein n=1 Tax=Clostridium tepidiprofundi DSM 19306 TaxID=1121338 RepID=A0A151AIB1_9CLOT|nr:hypothetical protein [Clostridium tepidiprofundi]KYH27334.1 hypothetical protein CLTEP_27830 [Clostridium tepidiprofundi DSM 19306]
MLTVLSSFAQEESKNVSYNLKCKEGLKSDNALVRYKSKQFIEILKNAKPIEKFDMDLFFSIVEKMVVFDGKKIIVGLLDGTEIEVVIGID